MRKPETMQEILDCYSLRLFKGQILQGTVTDKNEAGFLVDVGFKCEGFLPMREYTNRALIEDRDPMPGDKIEVEVVSVRNSEEAQLVLSRWWIEYDKRWAMLESELSKSQMIQVKGISRVKGGLMVNAMGLEGFVPVSHLTLAGRSANPQNFVGQSLKVKVLDHDKRKHRLVFSRKAVLEEERKAESHAYSPDDVKRYISIIREISPSMISGGYRVVILCNNGFNPGHDTECNIITCLDDAKQIEPCQKIALIPFSCEILGEAVNILAEKTYELRIICGVG